LGSNDRAAEPTAEHHEVYLELLTVDLDDDGDILAFVNRHGPLNFERDAGTVTPFFGFTDHPYFHLRIRPELERWRYQALYDWIEADRDAEDWFIAQSLTEFRWQAGCLRDLVAAWRFVNEGRKPEHLWSWVWEDPSSDEYNDPSTLEGEARQLAREYTHPSTAEGAAHLLARGLNEGLAVFHPHIQVDSEIPPYHRTASFYEICCLELFNHIAEKAQYRTCQNEPCQRVFVRQIGRAEHGQYRSEGVKYCSRECARAQAQRNYRRRKRRPA
jgi:hypothetical protein